MMARGVAIAFLAMLAGCTTAKEIYLPNGSKGQVIRCDGIGNRMDDCYQKAGDVCGSKGYDLATPPGSYSGISSLFIKCKE
jgi:hypothetical protein